MKFFIPVRSDRGTGDMRGERATTDTCSLHEKQLLRASWDNLHWTKYFSDRSDDWNICQTIYTWCQWEHCCKRITFRILEIVSLPFRKQFFQCWMTRHRIVPSPAGGHTDTEQVTPSVHFSCYTTKCTFYVCQIFQFCAVFLCKMKW